MGFIVFFLSFLLFDGLVFFFVFLTDSDQVRFPPFYENVLGFVTVIINGLLVKAILVFLTNGK